MGTGEKVLTGAALVGAHVAGTIYGVRRNERNLLILNQRIEQDCQALHQASLPPSANPPMDTRPRAERHIVVCHLAGMALGAVIAGLLTALVCSILLQTTDVQATAAERHASIVFASLGASIVGLLIPGLPLASIIWLRESRKRVDDSSRGYVALYWEERERVMDDIRAGRCDFQEAERRLASFWLQPAQA
mgnify:CR=1 FL=1